MEIIGFAFLTAMAFILVMMKIGIGRFTRFHWQSDVVISGILAAIFVGSFTGMLIGLIAGIFISLFLSLAKRVRG
jgi:thiamine transporter ThiT